MPSTVIAEMKYHPEKNTLWIRFVSGLIYEYLDVPAEEYDSMKNAASKGSYLNQHIKGHYRYRKIS